MGSPDTAPVGAEDTAGPAQKAGIENTAGPAQKAGSAETAAAARVPLTGLARLDGLLGEVRLCGVPVELMTTGTPRDLPADVDLAAYRVVQDR
jgi:hypothetical protein